MKHLIAVLSLFIVSLSLSAQPLPTEGAFPGGVVHLPLNTPKENPPKVIYKGHSVMVVNSESTPYAKAGNWVALIGIPLSAKPGTQTVTINGQPLAFTIDDKAYKEQRLVIKNKRKVNPTSLDMDRISREKTEILTALASWSIDRDPITQLAKPAQGPYSSPFGLRRFFNDQPRKPHSGLDIAAPKGDPIVAPAAGTVVATGDYFFNGNTVILDHGHGLTTMYCHMDRIDVTLGDKVNSGDQLGTIGNTGRVTGPHLHWGVSLNNARIDPLLLMVDNPS